MHWNIIQRNRIWSLFFAPRSTIATTAQILRINLTRCQTLLTHSMKIRLSVQITGCGFHQPRRLAFPHRLRIFLQLNVNYPMHSFLAFFNLFLLQIKLIESVILLTALRKRVPKQFNHVQDTRRHIHIHDCYSRRSILLELHRILSPPLNLFQFNDFIDFALCIRVLLDSPSLFLSSNSILQVHFVTRSSPPKSLLVVFIKEIVLSPFATELHHLHL